MINIEELANKIRVFIANRDITTSKMERDAGIQHGTLRTLIHGNSKSPNIFLVMRIAKYMGVSLDSLLEFNHDQDKKLSKKADLAQNVARYIFSNEDVANNLKWKIATEVFEFCAGDNHMEFDKNVADFLIKKELSKLKKSA